MGFVEQYFIDPLVQGTGYNIYNTVAYALILILAAFATLKLLRYLKIKIDDKFVFGVFPFIILGGALRALEDAQILSSLLFKTPLIYFAVFAVAFVALAGSKLAERYVKLAYHKIWFIIGIALVLIFLTQVTVVNQLALTVMVVLTIFWTILLIFVKKFSDRIKKLEKFFTWENTAILDVHMFDATTTFVAISYFPYFEQHVLPSFLIGLFGPAVMFVLKFVVIAIVLHVLDKEVNKKEERMFIKFIIIILGLAPGLRNFLRLIMGV